MDQAEIMQIHFEKQHPLHAIAVASNRLHFLWYFEDIPDNDQILSFLKIQSSDSTIFSTNDFQCLSIPFTFHDRVYVIGIIVSSICIDADILKELSKYLKLLQDAIYQLLEESEQFATISQQVRSISENIVFLLSHTIPVPKISSMETSALFSTALTSHLQTQMTTIIEYNGDESDVLFNFLSCFLTERSLKHSSSDIHPYPISGLYLQMISPQESIPIQHLMNFQRPWTYIRKKRVLQFDDITTQEQISSGIHVERYIPRAAGVSQWVLTLLKEAQNIPSFYLPAYCSSKVVELFDKASVLQQLVVNEIDKQEICFIRPQRLVCMMKMIGCTDQEEMRILVALANFIDQRMFQRVYACKKAVLGQMVASV